MTEVPIWFGPAERPLFGWFHAPDNESARAAVLICPPVGHEYHESYSTLRLLAEKLVDQGICSLRMDYDGVGDSAGDYRDPERAQAWSASVDAGLATLRRAGATSVVLIGMRLGALLAGLAAARDGSVDGVVLWDPVASGRGYLLEQRALNAFSAPAPQSSAPDGLVQVPGMVFSTAGAKSLSQLDLAKTTGPLAPQTLVLARPDRAHGPLEGRLTGAGVKWEDATGQAELMELGSAYGFIALEALERVVSWTTAIAPPRPAPMTMPTWAGRAVVARSPGGSNVTEIPMAIGPAGLFGILTEGPRRAGSPTVVLLNVANGNRTGPDRLWVELAREWAAKGLRCFRFDLSGLGDSPTRRPGQARFVARAPESFDDVADVCRALEPVDPSNVVLIGSCTSGYQVLESALQLRPRSVVAINPETSFRLPEKSTSRRADPRRRVAIPRRAVLDAYYRGHYSSRPDKSSTGEKPGAASAPAGRNTNVPSGKQLGLKVANLLRSVAAPRSAPVRWLRERERVVANNVTWRLRMLESPGRRPASWLKDLVDDQVGVFIVCSQDDARSILFGVRKPLLADLEGRGLRLVRISDHGFRALEERDAVTRAITEHVSEHFFSPAPAAIDAHTEGTPRGDMALPGISVSRQAS